jgi:hypothetical protein
MPAPEIRRIRVPFAASLVAAATLLVIVGLVYCSAAPWAVAAACTNDDQSPRTIEGMILQAAGCTTNKWGEFDSMMCHMMFGK